MPKSKAILVRVPVELFEKLEKIRKKKGKLSIPEVVRDAISDYINKEGNQVEDLR